MKENNIEEDIKLLEEFSNENVLYGSTVGMTLEKYKDLQLSTEHIISDYKRLQEEFKQVDHECERLEESEEILNKMKNKYKLALFMVIRNSMVMPQGIKLGKTDKEINEMSYETMCSVLTMIDYDQAEKIYKGGKDGK